MHCKVFPSSFSCRTVRVKLNCNQTMIIGKLAVTDAFKRWGNIAAHGRSGIANWDKAQVCQS